MTHRRRSLPTRRLLPDRRSIQRDAVLVAGVAASIVLAACGSSTSNSSVGPSQAVDPSASWALPVTPGPTASPSAASGQRSSLVVEEAHGLVITIPDDWLAIASGDARDKAKVGALRAVSADQADRVDALVDAIEKHPEYWFAAMRDSDEAVVTSQIREFDDFNAWRRDQQAALDEAYGTVSVRFVTLPREGWSYSWINNGLYLEMVAFERPGGAALFTFAGRPSESGLPALWDDVYATFTDAGN